ncbi:MAG: sigma-70 family RNA polymerase sigma factor [Anaerolineales bacterium]
MLDVNELVRRAQEGDSDAFSTIFHQYYTRIFRYVRSKLSSHHAAEDLTGEVFLRMIDKLPAYRITGVPFQVWLFTVARHLVWETYRKSRGNMPVSLDEAEAIPHPDKEPARVVEKQLTLESVQQALSQLDPSQQEVIRLRFLAGMPLQEVALTLDKSIAAVKALQHRGLEALRSQLEPYA